MPGNAVPFKKVKEEGQAAARRAPAAKTKTKEAAKKKGGKSESVGGAEGAGEASRSETRMEMAEGGEVQLPPKHSAAEGEGEQTAAE
jgi:hypothetical protein